ncbi:hypothetical protein NDU88_006479 [Pleurodeles waltl]|uniref:Uncharacterized protein n=1 Tax=Pleurodeles waltl TaxID=8319 RepID=A0AAV7LFI6_PLEWA|nr:hypothetical protein NDU88_006479 [Pleurodeles waltl]
MYGSLPGPDKGRLPATAGSLPAGKERTCKGRRVLRQQSAIPALKKKTSVLRAEEECTLRAPHADEEWTISAPRAEEETSVPRIDQRGMLPMQPTKPTKTAMRWQEKIMSAARNQALKETR